MGYIIHDAIIVTGFRKADVNEAYQHATNECGLDATTLHNSPMNGFWSFLIVPDGSKEGWADSDTGEIARAKWIEWAKGCYARGVFFDWVAVRYGGDLETGSRVTDSNNPDPDVP